LGREDRRLVIWAFVTVALVRLALWVVPSARVFRGVERRSIESARGPSGKGIPSPERLAWALQVASRTVPGASCLTQALAGHLMLARAGKPGLVRIGVRRSQDGQFQAHAWLLSGTDVLVGNTEVDQYKVLLQIPANHGEIRRSEGGR
jgi:hypothetical protein